MTERPAQRPRARILGRGAVVTIEDREHGTRSRVRVHSRAGQIVQIEPLPGGGTFPHLREGSGLILRVARPSGLFCFRAVVEGITSEGWGMLRLEEPRPRRRQLRGYFRMPVRFGVLLEVSPEERTAPMLRACDLSGSGILLLDPDGRLRLQSQVRLGLPAGPNGEVVRLPARVIRIQEDPRRAALIFDEISESSRLLLLRYLFREHRRRRKLGQSRMGFLAPVTPIERP